MKPLLEVLGNMNLVGAKYDIMQYNFKSINKIFQHVYANKKAKYSSKHT